MCFKAATRLISKFSAIAFAVTGLHCSTFWRMAILLAIPRGVGFPGGR
jgi:hypothetical protein